MADDQRADPLDGKEQSLISALITTYFDAAKNGDKEAADKVIKLLQLRRAYKRDREVQEVS